VNLKERFDGNQTKLQQLIAFANRLAEQRQEVMEQAMRLSGEQQLLSELLKEDNNAKPGGPTEAAGEAAIPDKAADNPQHPRSDTAVASGPA
jgi:hypothetical protein